MLQIATHPLLTSAPTVHPVINAAHQALAKLRAAGRELPPIKKAGKFSCMPEHNDIDFSMLEAQINKRALEKEWKAAKNFKV